MVVTFKVGRKSEDETRKFGLCASESGLFRKEATRNPEGQLCTVIGIDPR